MKLRDALRSARSYLTILIGFLIGFAIVVWVEHQMPKRVEAPEGIMLSKNFPPLPDTRALTLEEALWARVAWQYFVNNTQPGGLSNAQAEQPWFSLWSTGSYLLATISAFQLHIISPQEFDDRIDSALAALASLPLLPDGRPATWYHAETLQPLENGQPNTGSAVDLGRLLMPMQILLWRYPQHADEVRQLLIKWQLTTLFRSSGPQSASLPVTRWIATDEARSSYGFRLYVADVLRMTGSGAGLAVTQPPEGLKMVEIDGIMVPDEGLRTPWGKQPSLVSQPYLLTGLEQGFDARSGEITWRIMQILQKRTGGVSQEAVNTDYAEQAPDYSLSASGQPQNAAESEAEGVPQAGLAGRALVSTRAAFGWYALFRNAWSDALRRQMIPMLEPGKGWKAGFNADGSANEAIDADTNAMVLESLNYISQGQLLCISCPAPALPPADPTTDVQKGVTP